MRDLISSSQKFFKRGPTGNAGKLRLGEVRWTVQVTLLISGLEYKSDLVIQGPAL